MYDCVPSLNTEVGFTLFILVDSLYWIELMKNGKVHLHYVRNILAPMWNTSILLETLIYLQLFLLNHVTQFDQIFYFIK